jgi:two-component system, OmpR family, phosphate regulon response regulator PhoB
MRKILVVDDQVEVRELVEVTLRGDEVAILQAGSGEEALAVVRSKKPDLVLMDVMMPGRLDGLETTRAIKADPATRGCTVILLTAKGQETDRRRGLDAGAEAYFTKPFSPLALIECIESYLD